MKIASLTVLAFLLAGGVMTSCTRQLPVSRALSPFVPAPETGPYSVIGYLEHRDRIVTIKTGEQGTVYSVRNKDGKVLYENLTAEQLKVQSPEIHDFIEAATAGQASVLPSIGTKLR